MSEITPTMEVAVISVGGMSCQGCANRLQKSLASTPGVTHANVDLPRNEAHITFDADTSPISHIMQSINKLGFEAKGFTRGPASN